jgi:outer membrane autotransporter protein
MNGPSAALTGSATGSGTDTFRLAGSGANTFDVSQIGAGWTLLDKAGTSNWTLTGTSTYAGPVTVTGGTLSVNGNLASASSVTVASGATLGGIGTLPSTTINAGGTLAPGNSIGTININGNLVIGAGAIYRVEVSPASSDRTNVTGTATLGAGVQVAPLARLTTRTTYTILSAATLSGTFSSAAVDAGNNFARNPVLSYAGGNVLLTLDPGLLSPLLTAAATANQRGVAGGIDNAIQAGNPLTGFGALFSLSAAALPGALDQLSGEVHASTAGALVDESSYVRSAVLGRLRQASYSGDAGMAALSMGGPQAFAGDQELNAALGYAKPPMVTKAPLLAPAPSRDIVFWSQGFGAWGKFNGDGNAAALSRDLAGVITGFDARFGNWRGGIAAGYTASRNNTDGRGSANVDTGHIAAYGGVNVGALNLRAGGAYAFHTIDTDRTVIFPGFFDRATAHYQGGTGQIFGEAGYGFAFGKLAVEPYAGAAWVRLDTDAFSEKGGAAALNVAASSFEVGYSTLGVRAASLVPLENGMVVIPRASVAWQHAFNSVTPDATVAFQNVAGSFVVAGVPIARDALLAEAGVDLAISRNATIGVSYTGQIANNVQDHAAKGKFSWKF